MKHLFTISLCFLALSLSAQVGCIDFNACNYDSNANNNCEVEIETFDNFNYMGSLNGSSYYLYQNTSTWNSAQQMCQSLGGYLVTISSTEENNLVKSYIPSWSYPGSPQIWIGYALVNGVWEWVNGEANVYENFASGEPSGGSETIGLMWQNGTWNDGLFNSGAQISFLMERNCCDYPDFGGTCQIQGCFDSTASNFNPNATEDDGSCTYTGCMDTAACNFNPEAIEDDESCDYSCCPGPGCCNDGTIWDEETQTCLIDESFCGWQPDGNADGLIGVEDLLDLLAVYGDTDLDFDGVWDSIDDCLDLEACNYDANPTEPCGYIDALGECGGGCEADADGDAICDDIDDCIGVVDECGVCNGPGATEVVIESITLLYDSVYAEQIDNWFVFEVGADTTFSYECPSVFQSCGDPVSHEGYDYSTVQIVDQCWFSENCRYLPEVSPSSASSTTAPYYYVYGYEGTDVASAMSTSNYETSGVLYNWPAVMTEGICPSGWHIPSDGEWQTMEISLGMSESEAAQTGWRGSPVGDYMKSTSGWDYGGNGSNSSGFTCLPGGYSFYGGFLDYGNYGVWWSASEFGSYSWIRSQGSYDGNVFRNSNVRDYGVSARCVIDYTDECGVINGDNSTCLDDCGVPNGDNSTCSTSCGDPISHEGYNYSTVQIGNQCWFSENCRYLPEVSPSSEGSETESYYYVYDYQGTDVEAAEVTENYGTYGVLYNWPAVMAEGICPSSWHIPSDEEWTQLTDFLGGASGAGGKMKEVGYDHWNSPNTGATNSSGFTGLPGGYRENDGFHYHGSDGYWWSTSGSGIVSWDRRLSLSSTYVNRISVFHRVGFSVRCIKD